MPPKDRGSVDLFIPVGRRSRSSSLDTTSTNNTTTLTITPSESTSQTEVSSTRGTDPSSSSANSSSTFIPSSGLRYTIAAQTYGQSRTILHSPVVLKTSSSPVGTGILTSRRHSRKLDPASTPVHDLDSHLNQRPQTEHYVPALVCDVLPELGRSDSIPRTGRPKTSSARSSNPKPGGTISTERGRSHNLDSSPHLSVSRAEASVDNTTQIDSAALVDKPIVRGNSPGSLRSSKERSRPPPSFPSNFYERFPEHREPWMSPPKSKTVEVIAAPPLKRAMTYTISSTPSEDFPISPTRIMTPTTDNHANDPQPNTFSSSRQTIISNNRHSLSNMPRSYSSSPSRASSRSSHYSGFHETIHHYTTCPHSSPPATRPLDVQPCLEPLTPSSRTNISSVRSTIAGSCFDCDTSSRRDAETQILLQYNPEISKYVADLSHLVSHLEGASPTSSQHSDDEAPTTPIARAFAALNCDDDLMAGMNDHDMDSFASQIREIERLITDVTSRRDRDVKDIWKGYTARWGPGTLGVANMTPEKRLSLLNGGNCNHERRPSQANSSAPRTPERSPSHKPSQHSGSRASSRNSLGNQTGITYAGKSTPDGRMRVDWIRDG